MFRAKLGRLLLVAMVLSGALLGFSMQPLIGRMLANSFGSAVHVWLTSMIFFQGALFLGYLYAHGIAGRLGRYHLLILLLPFAFLPFEITAAPAPGAPMFEVLWALIRYTLVPFTIVSTTAVIAQLWLSNSDLEGSVEPYPLYAASNIGSLLGLFGYPLLIEPLIGIHMQSWVWAAAYSIYVALVVSVWVTVRQKPKENHMVSTAPFPQWQQIVQWMLLAALPSGFLLAVTNVIVLEVGSFPLVWVIPLGAYLGTFIIAFRDGSERWRNWVLIWPELSLMALILFRISATSIRIAMAHVLVLTAVASVAHLELYARRPHPHYLTLFYLTTSFGGWIGGSIVTIFAPIMFKSILEYPMIILMFMIAFAWITGQKLVQMMYQMNRKIVIIRIFAIAWLGFLLIPAYRSWVYEQPVFALRNFYGFFRVMDQNAGSLKVRKLVHGTTLHGEQLLHPLKELTPTVYYANGGCIQLTYATLKESSDVGVIGLGAGVVAAYTRPGDTIHFYEIDPDNEKIAREWFTFIENAQADKLDITQGDGRLELDRADIKFDWLLIDAFSGDSVPFHLLTVEAIQVYLDHLKPNGLLVFHVSNRFFELRPVLAANARVLGLQGRYNGRLISESADVYVTPANCVALARSSDRFIEFDTDSRWTSMENGWPSVSPWTDDYIQMLSALRFTGTSVNAGAIK